MKLKLDDNGNAVLQEGIPVWVADDGKEIPYNVPDLVGKLSSVNAESAGRRKDVDALSAQLKAFEGIDPGKAKAALETIANLDAGKLIDAGKVEEVKKQLGETWKQQLDMMKENLAKTEKDYSEKLTAKDTAIRNLLVKGIFDSSTFLKERTVLPPDMAYASFGSHFEVREEEGQFKVIPVVDGKPIPSRINPGEIASPEEALESIFEKYPFKDRILRDTLPAGSGASKFSYSGVGTPRTYAECKTPQEKAAYLRDPKNLKKQ